MPEPKKMTAFEIQLKIEALRVEVERAKREGHTATASECQKVINTYRRRLVAAQKREDKLDA